uniref:Uncharacterized protein n=1 Tax=Avena sativa TaxID=4498 RepID=A0ACD5WUL5_AVESA
MAMSPPPSRRGPLSVEPLLDDLMREIFLRLPPHDPRGLVRAAAGCRSWRDILSDPAFAREYRRFRRAPPMLGYLYDERHTEGRRPFDETYWLSHFASTATFRPPARGGRRDWRVLDSRHGLVLFYTPTMDAAFVVCDLVTGDEWEIHPDSDCKDIMWWEDDDDEYRFENIHCNAGVLCSRSDRCDHLDCHGGPFRVALVGSDEYGLTAFATVYSSETGEWSDMISVYNENCIDGTGHSAVVGNKVYVPCFESDSVVEYNMGEEGMGMSVIDAPFVGKKQPYIQLMGVEDGMLLFASVVNPRLYLWSMEASPRGTAGWARRRVINLEPFLPPPAPALQEMSDVLPIGFAEGVGVIFLKTKDGLYRLISIQANTRWCPTDGSKRSCPT